MYDIAEEYGHVMAKLGVARREDLTSTTGGNGVNQIDGEIPGKQTSMNIVPELIRRECVRVLEVLK